MSKTAVFNVSRGPLSLPEPYVQTPVLPGKCATLTHSATTVLAALGGASAIPGLWKLVEVPATDASTHDEVSAYAAPSTIGTANAEGAATTVSRSDHVHAHGNQTATTLHAVVGAGAGFMSAADKTKLDGIAEGATVGSVSAGADIISTSLVPSDLLDPEWRGYGAIGVANTPRMVRNSEGYAWVNHDAATAGAGYLSCTAVADTGVTEGSFWMRAKRPGATDQTIILEVLDPSLAVLETLTCVLTATMTTFTVDPATLTPGLAYILRISFDSGVGDNVQQSAIVESVGFDVLTGPAFWTGAHKRLPANATTLGDNLWNTSLIRVNDATPQNSIPFSSATAPLTFDTTETSFKVQYVDSNPGALELGFSVWVDGVHQETVSTTKDSLHHLVTITLPDTGTKRVMVRQGLRVSSTIAEHPVNGVVKGSFVVAVYAASLTYVPPEKKSATLVVFGDSIAAGFYATEPVVDGWGAQLRRRFAPLGNTILETVAGGSSYGYINSAALRRDFISQLIAVGCTHLVLQHCRNDWSINGGAGWANAAAHEVAYTALLNETMARMPWLRIFCVWGLYEQDEGALFGGEAQSAYRTSISNSVTAAANANVVLIQGTSFFNWDATHFGADPTHPNDFGQVEAGAKCADEMDLP